MIVCLNSSWILVKIMGDVHQALNHYAHWPWARRIKKSPRLAPEAYYTHPSGQISDIFVKTGMTTLIHARDFSH
jgi:hypothetical protein